MSSYYFYQFKWQTDIVHEYLRLKLASFKFACLVCIRILKTPDLVKHYMEAFIKYGVNY